MQGRALVAVDASPPHVRAALHLDARFLHCLVVPAAGCYLLGRGAVIVLALVGLVPRGGLDQVLLAHELLADVASIASLEVRAGGSEAAVLDAAIRVWLLSRKTLTRSPRPASMYLKSAKASRMNTLRVTSDGWLANTESLLSWRPLCASRGR